MTRPIRVLRIIARLNVGGPAIHVTLLTEKLGPPDYESTLVCGSIDPGEGDMRYYAEAHGVTPLVVPELGRGLNPARDLATTWKLYRLIRRLKPDIVHTHTAKAGFSGRLAAWLAGVPVIVHTFHGHVFQGYFSPAVTRMFILLERLTARLSDTVIVLTEGLQRELSQQYRITSAGHMTVLPLGLDLRPFSSTPRGLGGFRRAQHITPEAPLIGIIGRLVPVKNHALFLQAAVRVRAQLPGAQFVIVGDGDDAMRQSIRDAIAALGLQDAVTMTGWVRDVAPVCSDLDVLVISSLNEGTPVSVIEALACGCPVVSTAVGGVPDLLEGGRLGRLTPPGDAAALAQAILDTLANPPEAAALRAAVLQSYSIDRLAGDLDALYRRLLAKKGRLPDRA